MNNNFIQNTNETFGGISKKFLARLVAIIIEKISDRTLTVENDLLKISGPNNVLIRNKGNVNPGIFVDTNNNVGIGTSTPAYKLHLLGDMKIEGDFFIKGTTYTVDTGNQVTDAIIVTNHDTETALTVNMVGSYPIVEFKSNNNLVSILTSSGCLGIGINEPNDKLEVNGFIKALQGYKVNDILIFDASTNATFSGTLDLSKNFTINNNMFKVIANTGDVISKGTLLVYDDATLSKNVAIIGILNVGQSKFIVYTNGSVDMQGDLKINTTKFVVEAITGDTTIEGILKLLNDFNINNKFIVNHSTGDTQISGSVQIYENLNVNNFLIADNVNKNVLVKGNIDVSNNANIGGNLNISGDFNISGNVNFNSNFSIANNFTVQNSGDVYMVGELKLSKQIIVNNTKFIVDVSGNIYSEGSLTLLDNFNVNTNKFTINATNGDTYIDNTLTVNNKLLTNNINDTINFNNNIININKQINLSKSLNINTDKFNVDYSTGNVNVAGTLDILKNSHFYESMIINKNVSIGEYVDISGNLTVNKNVTINENTRNIGNMVIDKSLNVNDIFIINSLTKQISFGVANPIYDVDISGNMRIDNIMINKNLGFNGYLFMMTDTYDPSIKFKVFTNDYNVYKYESSIITFTKENNSLVRTVIEFDLNNYLPNIDIRYIDFSFDLYINSSKQENNGNGFTISLFNSLSYDTILIQNLNYDIDLSGYTIYLNVFENQLQLYKGGLIINQISINSLINNSYHNCKIIVNNNTVILKINNVDIITFTVAAKPGKYIALGGWTSSNTLTQKAKNIKCYAEYDNCTKKLQVFGESFLKKTTIDGNMRCNGYIQLDGPIITKNNKLDVLNKLELTNDLQLSGNIINNGVLIDMNNIGDFFYTKYLIGNDFLFDNSNNEMKLTEKVVGSVQTIVEFNLNEYIDNNIVDEFVFEADFISTGRGIWFYFYNDQSYTNSYLAYMQEINGYCLLIDDNNTIQFFEKASSMYNFNYTPVQNWQKIYIQVKNDNLILKVNNIEYINRYYKFLYKGNYFGIGALNGLQKVKNIKITGKINNSNKKLNIFGNTILKGNAKITGYTKYYQDVDICGNLNINKYMNVNNLLVVNNSNTNINNNLNITGNLNFTGGIYQNGTLLDISTQNPMLWLINNNSYYTNLNVGIGKSTTYYNLDVSGNINCTNGYFVNNNKIIDENGRITSSAYIPLLNATKISTGILANERIPELNASKITTGIISVDRIPDLDASKITSGKLINDVLPNNIDISGNITANKYNNLPIIGNSVLVNSNLVSIVNPYNTSDIIVTANLFSLVQENIIVQIKSVTSDNIEFSLSNIPVNTSYINYIILKK
jgi:UDP-3-O-[3-hydroxymyristoyl] glucosamine N-acyltransferase